MRFTQYLNILNERYDEKFITDFGRSYDPQERSGKGAAHIAQYAVWGDTGRGKPEVIETSDDLDYLLDKYGDLKIVKM